MLIPISQFPTRSEIPMTEMTPPKFDLLEQEDFYLLSIDLPGITAEGTEVALGKNCLEVLTGKQGPEADVLFRCRTQTGAVRTVYYEGALWLMLPKSGRQECTSIGA